MKLKKSLFLLSTPSQAFFLSHTPQLVSNAVLIITVKKQEEERKILKYIEHLDWKEIQVWFTGVKEDGWEQLLLPRLRFKIFWFKIFHHSFERVFIGSYVNIIHLSVLAEYERQCKSYLLYDGLQMISTNLIRNQKEEEKVKNFPKPYKRLGFKKPEIKSLTYVSPLDLQVQEDDSLYLINNKVDAKEKRNNKEIIYFIGQPLPGIGLVTDQFYLDSLEKFKKKYSEQKVFYFPHPRENSKLISSIENIFEIKYNNVVFEEYFLGLPNPPGIVASFYSSVLTNLIFFNTSSKIIALEIPSRELNRYKSKVSSVYEYFHIIKNDKFQVVNLEEVD